MGYKSLREAIELCDKTRIQKLLGVNRNFNFIPYVDFIIQNRPFLAKKWLENLDPKMLGKNPNVVKKSISDILNVLIETEKYAFATDMVTVDTVAKIIKKEEILDLALKEATEEYINIISENNYKAFGTLLQQLKKILSLISLGADYNKENIASYQCSTLMVLIDGLPSTLVKEVGAEFKSKAYQDFLFYYEEGRARKMLGHRFGLQHETIIQKQTFSVEGTRFFSGVLELKYSYKRFLQNRDVYAKIKNILVQNVMPIFGTILKQITFHDYLFQDIIAQTEASIEAMFSTAWYDSADEKPKMMDVILVPVSTYYPNSTSRFNYHVEAFALFSNRLFKMNRGMGSDEPGIEIYQTKFSQYDQKELSEEIHGCMDSLKERLVGKSWGEGLISATGATLLSILDKKPQSSGNCGWATAKLLVYSAIYAAVFQCCKRQNLKDKKADDVAATVAYEWYKLFTEFDRCYAIDEYLALHEGPPLMEIFYFDAAAKNLGNFLHSRRFLQQEEVDYDKDLLEMIYQKQMNKLMRKAFAKSQKSDKFSQAFITFVKLGIAKGWDPYHYAIETEDRMLLETLIKSRIIPKQNDDGNTLLHQVAREGKYKLCQWLIQEKLIRTEDLLVKNDNDNTAFHVAIYNSNLDIAEFLVNINSELNTFGLGACLESACEYEELESIEFILKNGGFVPSNVNLHNYTKPVQTILKAHMPVKDMPPKDIPLKDMRVTKPGEAILAPTLEPILYTFKAPIAASVPASNNFKVKP